MFYYLMHQLGEFHRELTNIFWDGHLKVIAQYAVGALNRVRLYKPV